MSDSIIIALDGMGGDHAPESVVEGAHLALKRHPNLRYIIFGDNTRILPLVAQFSGLKDRVNVSHTDDVVAPDAKPSAALRQGKKSSMQLAIDAVKNGQARGIISAGNTGALMAMSKLSLRMLPTIQRPAITTTIPTMHGRCVMLDLGANIDCTPQILCQFAVMGDAFARAVLDHPNPSVGLLNIGAEEVKGHETLKEAYQKLKETPSINFHGFVEGDDITHGTVDVVVTDGFAGNVALKAMEGTAKFITSSLKNAFQSSILGKIGYLIAKPALQSFRQTMDPRQHNGGVFLGLNGITVKSHGGADAEAFANAIHVTAELIKDDVNGRIIREMQKAHLGVSVETQQAVEDAGAA